MTTLIHKAAKWAKPALLRRILASGADVNEVDALGCTPLDYAIKFGNTELAEFLKTAGAKTTSKNTNIDNVKNKLFLDKTGGDIDNNSHDVLAKILEGITSQDTPRGDLINLVHSRPTIVNNIVLAQGMTLLHLAAKAGKLKIVQWLIDKGADPTIIDANGYSPQELADNNGFSTISEYLSSKISEQLQTEHPSQATSTTKGAFIDNGDGTVTDIHNQLTWMRCALGQQWDGVTCTGVAASYTWDQAAEQHPVFAGHSDWGLPNIGELQSIIDSGQGNPTIDPAAFPNAPSLLFWSGTAANSNCACYISFLSGLTYESSRSCTNHVRLIRGGQAYLGYEGYVDNKDGTVTDPRTGLTWMRCALGQTWNGTSCVGKTNTYTWLTAISFQHVFAGHEDWRLPDLGELHGIVELTRSAPAINWSIFPNTENLFFWTSSLSVHDAALGISFGRGIQGFDSKSGDGAIRLVRDGKQISVRNIVNPELTKSIEIARLAASLEKPVQFKSATESVVKPRYKYNAREDSGTKSQAVLQETGALSDHVILPLGGAENKNDNITLFITEIMERLDLYERRFETTASRVEAAIGLLSTGQSKTYEAINQLHQLSAASVEKFTAELAELRHIFVSAAHQSNIASPTAPSHPVIVEPEATALDSFVAFTAWLVDQEFITLSAFRNRLLPLDLLPNAVINDINERALDLTGEPALIEDGDTVIVQKAVLLQVIAVWDVH